MRQVMAIEKTHLDDLKQRAKAHENLIAAGAKGDRHAASMVDSVDVCKLAAVFLSLVAEYERLLSEAIVVEVDAGPVLVERTMSIPPRDLKKR